MVGKPYIKGVVNCEKAFAEIGWILVMFPYYYFNVFKEIEFNEFCFMIQKPSYETIRVGVKEQIKPFSNGYYFNSIPFPCFYVEYIFPLPVRCQGEQWKRIFRPYVMY